MEISHGLTKDISRCNRKFLVHPDPGNSSQQKILSAALLVFTSLLDVTFSFYLVELSSVQECKQSREVCASHVDGEPLRAVKCRMITLRGGDETVKTVQQVRGLEPRSTVSWHGTILSFRDGTMPPRHLNIHLRDQHITRYLHGPHTSNSCCLYGLPPNNAWQSMES